MKLRTPLARERRNRMGRDLPGAALAEASSYNMFHEMVDVFPESRRHQAFFQARRGRTAAAVQAGFPEKRGQPLFIFRIEQFPVPAPADQAGGAAAPGNQAEAPGGQRIIDNRPKRFHQAGQDKKRRPDCTRPPGARLPASR